MWPFLVWNSFLCACLHIASIGLVTFSFLLILVLVILSVVSLLFIAFNRFALISGAVWFVTGVTAASRYVLFTRFLKFSSLLILVVSLRLYDRFGPSGKLSARLIVRCTASPREFTS